MTPPDTPLPSAFPAPGPTVYAMRAAFAVGGRVAPGAAARAAERLLCRPPTATPRPTEAAFLADAVVDRFDVRAHAVARYVWPGNGPTVVLLHGWGGYSGRWWVIGGALRAAGFRLVALDGPAHGRTPGRRATLPEFAECLAAVARAEGAVHGVVGYSLGAAAIPVALQLKGLQASRAVLIAPPAAPAELADQLQRFLWWPDAVHRRMIRSLETRLGHRMDEFDIPSLAAARTERALLIHDTDDPDVPYAGGAAIAAAWPGMQLHTTTGLGHRAIMRDPEVAARVTAFLRA